MRIPTALSLLAGARRDILERAPGDLPKHAAMGGVLLTTATVAGVSAFFALYSVFKLPWQVCTLGGIGWAVIVLNLDRMLVVTMSGLHSLPLKVITAVPRVLLALVIGWVISTPLVLQVFQPEIEAELTIMKAEALQRANQTLDVTYQQIGKLKAELQQLRDARDRKSTETVEDDLAVSAAKAEYYSAERNYQQRENEALAELDGTGGTGVPGVGEAYLQKMAAAQIAKGERDAAMTKLEAIRTQVKSQIEATAADRAADAQARIPIVEHDLAVAEERLQADQGQAHEAQNANTGLLVRLEALDRVTSEHLAAAWAHRMLFLLFVCIEVLPVGVKLLSTLGTPSLYDRLAQQDDERADSKARVQATREQEIAETRANASLVVAKQQADAQIEAGKAASRALADQQKKIALMAVNAWGRVATRRTEEELDRWAYEQDFRNFR